MSVQDEERYIDERERENRICRRASERERAEYVNPTDLMNI